MFGKRNSAAFSSLALTIVALGSAPARAQTEIWHYDDGCVDLDAMGDVDGDGVSDVIADAQSTDDLKMLSGVDGHVIASYTTSNGSALDGYSVVRAGDVDGDGFVDILAGDPNYSSRYGNPVGRIYFVSGKDGSILLTRTGTDASMSGSGFDEYMGGSLAAAGDADGDGYADVFYGTYLTPGSSWLSPKGPSKVSMNAFKSNQAIDTLMGGWFDLHQGEHNHALTGIGDVDGDGLDDYATAWSKSNTGIGTVEARKGIDGSLIWTRSSTKYEGYGIALRSSGDLDGDGVRELLIGATASSEHGKYSGRVDIVSGVNGTLLSQLFGSEADQHFGADMDTIRDVDGDGLPEIVVASFGTNLNHGRIELFSGGSGNQLALIDEASLRVRSAGDLNGDGVDDVVTTANAGKIKALSFDLAPAVGSVTPARIRYDQVGALAITGTGFTADPNLAVLIDGTPATNVVVTSFTDLTCTAPTLLPGPHDVTVTDKFGSATLAGGLLLTPAMFIDGDPTIGSRVYLRYEFDPLDSTFAIYGLPPQQSIPTPPFGGRLGIVPFFPLFTLKSFPSDEFIVHADIPNDPALSGVTVLFQSLTGPNFTGSGKDAAWSNVAAITIH